MKQEQKQTKEIIVKQTSKGKKIIRFSLKDVLQISETIENNNAGNPYDRLDLAKSMNLTPNGNKFRMLLIASRRYGVTSGGYTASKIELTDLGKIIMTSDIPDKKHKAILKAIHSNELGKIIDWYTNKKIPRKEVFIDTLKNEFNINPNDVDLCYNVFMANANDYGLIREIKESKYLKFDGIQLRDTTEEINPLEQSEEETVTDNPISNEEQEQTPKQIFVAHGKNHKPLDQLKTILDQFKVPYKIAIIESNQGRPISQKVSDLMRECSSAIFLFTKDEKTKDKEGNEIYRPNDNVVFELGAASVLYGKKIVIFKENGVSFGSDFKDLGYISFEDNQLNAKTIDLMKELVDLNLLKVSPT